MKYFTFTFCAVTLLSEHGRMVKVHEEDSGASMIPGDVVPLRPGRNTVTYEARQLKALLLQLF